MTPDLNVSATMRLFWLRLGESLLGPYDVAQIHAKLAVGEFTWQTQACPVGASDWRTLSETAGVGTISSPPETSPTAPLGEKIFSSVTVSRGRSWSPAALAWWGLLFTPMWTGVMAAINGRRLKTPMPIWIPLGIGFGATLADLILSAFICDSYLLDATLYFGALTALWAVVLKPQQELMATAHRQNSASWLWPALGGAPLGLMLIFAILIAPFIPLEPRQICERFAAASKSAEAEKYATANLVPALRAIFDQPDDGKEYRFELMDEGVAPNELGGYFVNFRLVAAKPVNDFRQAGGFFHLVHWDGQWKIEEMYFTVFNDQPLERWFAISANYQLFQNPSRESFAPATVPSAGATTAKNASSKTTTPVSLWLRPLIYAFGTSGAAKKAAALIGAAFVALWAGRRKAT